MLNKTFTFYLLQRYGDKLEGKLLNSQGIKRFEGTVIRYQNQPSSQCQGHNPRAPGCPCHSALHLPACHKSVLPVCNCISKCTTHFLPCGDIFIPVFKAGSSAVPQCSKGEALLVLKSSTMKDSSRNCCCQSHSPARESRSLFPTSPANNFTEHC